MSAPEIASSTREERREYIKNVYKCIADCDMCGICRVFHGKEPEIAFEDYIEGVRDYPAVAADYRQGNPVSPENHN